ncbi:MAG: RHS repeat-associated core domain-containing protein [Kamptonema sp. SIO1D9]|nr:RHS repeat-associated core domain-containing protein [Kamptonema sp. SIO1D9]
MATTTWLESNTDLYHMRARSYEPQTGRFLSRDPVEVIERVPESTNPYQFVYNNPHVYSDPTGLYTIQEVNVTRILQDILNHFKTEASAYFRDEAQGIVTELATDVLEKLLPIEVDSINKIDNLILAGKDPGEELENFIVNKGVCPVIQAVGFDRWFHNEPVIQTNGDPKTDGFKCSEPPIPKGKFPKGTTNATKPDFVISRIGPKSINPISLDKAWLIGDLKINTRKVRRDVLKDKAKEGQWGSISNFAKKYEYVPTALYITLYQNISQEEIEKIKKEAVGQGVTLFILPLTNIPGPKKK